MTLAEIHSQEFTYPAGEYNIPAWACYPVTGGPGVILLHAWWGLTPFFKRLACRLAEAGFSVLAPDMYGGGITAQTIEEAQAAMQASRHEYIEKAVYHAVEHVRRLPGAGAGSLATVGFSMGAAWSLELSTMAPDDIAAVALFYGSWMVDFKRARAAFQGHFAADDVWEPVEDVRSMEAEMHAAGRDAAFYVYPHTGHWFFEDNRPDAYRPEAAALAWQRTLDFLNAHLHQA